MNNFKTKNNCPFEELNYLKAMVYDFLRLPEMDKLELDIENYEQFNELNEYTSDFIPVNEFTNIKSISGDLESLKESYNEFALQNYSYRDIPLFSKCRKREYIYIRHFFYKLIKTKFSLTSIAIAKLSNRDHATILHSLKDETIDPLKDEIKKQLIQRNLFYIK